MKFFRKFTDLGITGYQAKWYDKSTKTQRMLEMKKVAEKISKKLQPGQTVLDVATGPGVLPILLSKMGDYKVTGIDISPDFVEISRRNALEMKAGNVEFYQGNVCEMPFKDNTFDFLVCTAAFKNFKDPVKSLTEMHRTLKPNSIAWIMDLNKDASNKDIKDYLNEFYHQQTPGSFFDFDKWFISFSLRTFLKNGAYTRDDMIKLIRDTPFNQEFSNVKTENITLITELVKNQRHH